MIKLYYTGARRDQDPQFNPVDSLGGYTSSTTIPNNRLGALFQNTDNEISEEFRIISVKNESENTLTSVQVYTEVLAIKPEPFEFDELTGDPIPIEPVSSIELAIAPYMQDSCAINITETLQDSSTYPYFAETQGYTVDIPLALGDFLPGEIKSLYVKRTIILPDETPEECNARLIEEFENGTNNYEEPKEDRINIFFSYV